MNLVFAICCLLATSFALVTAQYDYAEVLHKSILFYEAQRSGRLPPNNRIPWRGDSALNDRGIDGEDLTGGWYDAGDYVKFGLPYAMSTTALVWSGIEFRAAYQAAGELDNFLDCVRWSLDYMLKAHVATNNFYGQVGRGDLDHAYWGRPEDMTMERPAYKITTAAPGSDLAADTAAALAAGYLLFRETDAAYGFVLLDNARRLHDFAFNNRAFYHNSITDAGNYYRSSSFMDELAFGGAMLYFATNEQVYLDRALSVANTQEVAWAYDWDSKIVAYQLALFVTGQTQFRAPVESFLRQWFPGGSVPYTPKGLAWRSMWGSNRYSANAAFIALVARKYGILPAESLSFARSQIHYMLGDGGRSFVCGFGENPPQSPHHASSSCPDRPATCTWTDFGNPGPNPQVLYGALVGGPDQNDGYVDDRADYVANEVSCDYNSGFTGAVAGLLAAQLEME